MEEQQKYFGILVLMSASYHRWLTTGFANAIRILLCVLPKNSNEDSELEFVDTFFLFYLRGKRHLP
jgi:hypothetical protein